MPIWHGPAGTYWVDGGVTSTAATTATTTGGDWLTWDGTTSGSVTTMMGNCTASAYNPVGRIVWYGDPVSEAEMLQGLQRVRDNEDQIEAQMQQARAMQQQGLGRLRPASPPPPHITPEAEDRAKQLLLEHLTAEQRETFEKNRWFVVEGGKTKKKYKIHGGSLVANVEIVGERLRLCAHAAPHSVPHHDQLLAQKLYLECDEDAFLQKANQHPM